MEEGSETGFSSLSRQGWCYRRAWQLWGTQDHPLPIFHRKYRATLPLPLRRFESCDQSPLFEERILVFLLSLFHLKVVTFFCSLKKYHWFATCSRILDLVTILLSLSFTSSRQISCLFLGVMHWSWSCGWSCGEATFDLWCQLTNSSLSYLL